MLVTETLPPGPETPRAARGFISRCCEAARLPEATTDTAMLLTSELVTNAVLHAGSLIRLTFALFADCIRVEVHDRDVAIPRPGSPKPEDLAGRGLLIVDGAAHAWGVDPDPAGGKTIWFELLLSRSPCA